MKYRSRKYKLESEQQSYWPSFVDIMATVALVFFFIMIVSSAVSKMFVDNIVDERERLYKGIQKNLDENNVDKSVMEFSERDGMIVVKTEEFFDVNKSILKEDGKNAAKELRNVFESLLENPEIESEIKYIEIVGHTDYNGTTIENRELSTQRATSFLNEIVPLNSKLENEYGHKFKASGMSEFETNKTKDERSREDFDSQNKEEKLVQRKIEVRIEFSNDDIEEAIKLRYKENENKVENNN